MEKYCSILFIIIGLLHHSYGCSIAGESWLVPVTKNVKDTFRGNLFSGLTENIRDIITISQREGLNKGPYINVLLENSQLIISTNDDFENYEEYETQLTLGYTISFRCTDSTTRTLVLVINLQDTNNNDPIFLPTSEYDFIIAPPVPPGFVVTTCLNDILVRDIDLTTQKIDFKIKGSDLFEISLDTSSKDAKEFKAILKTTDLIRSIAEPITLTVTATDVDLTGDPPRTANAVVVITADSQFQFPDEPTFSQSFYLANYNGDNDVILQDKIFLRQGYDSEVKFSFESDHSQYFDLVIDQNSLSFNIKTPIPISLYDERQIYLVVKATREHTNGASATVILRLPEETRLEFENAIYKGKITDNVLQLSELKLKQGYEGFKITVDIQSEYTFRATIESNVIKISMDPLASDVIQNNNFINLQITASNSRTTAVTIVVLEIIKDDNTTPVFENNFYSGTYSTEIGLTLEPIILSQGFDETVKISLEGEHIKYFQTQHDGPRITLTAAIPSDIFDERNIMITVLASKPRTVGANAAINIVLPEPPEIDNESFDRILYNGKFSNGALSHDTITLANFDGKNIQITGEHSSSFSSVITNGVVKIETSVAEFPKDLTYIVLELQAASAKAILLIDVSSSEPPEIDDVSFDRILYNGKFSNGALSHDTITLSNFDGKNIQITGEHSSSFSSVITNGVVKIETSVAEFPKDLTYIVLELEAASAKAILLIDVSSSDPPEIDDVSFDRNLYNGKFHNGVLSHDTITLSNFDGKNIQITGEHSSSFSSEITNGVVKIVTTVAEFPKDVTFIVLELQAASANAILFIDVSSSEPPETGDVSFDQNLYNGKFQNGVLSHDTITLSGFDGKNIQITGEHSSSFSSEITNGVVKIKTSVAEFPKDLTYIVLKLQADSANAILFIDVSSSKPPEIDDVSFDRILYNGKFSNGALSHDTITLSNFDGKNIQITGEHSSSFSSVITNGVVKIETSVAEFPKDLTYIVLELEAASAKAILLIDVSSSDPPEIDDVSFDRNLYNGKFHNGVLSHDTITLSNFDGKNIQITGEHSSSFSSEITNGVVKIVTTVAEFPKDVTFIVLELQAASANAILFIDVSSSEPPETGDVSFDQNLYNGKFQNGVLSHDTITLSGFDGKNIQITGEHSSSFSSEITNGVVKIKTSVAEFPKDLTYIVLELQADSANAILFIDVSSSKPPEIDDVSFDRILYNGKISNGALSHDTITLSNFDGKNIQITGEHSSSFSSVITNGVVKIETSVAEFPKDLTYIVLELEAASAKAILLIDVSSSDPPEIDDVSFDRNLYNGKFHNGVLSHDTITLSNFDGKNIQITGEHSSSFSSEITNGVVKIVTTVAEFPKDVTFIVLELQAASANAILFIDVSSSEPPETGDVSFDQNLYNGKFQNGVLSHDTITLSGFDGKNIQITGEHSSSFSSEITNGVVKIKTSVAEFPKDLTYIVLELQADSANAILFIDVSSSKPPEIDDVSFDRILYNGKFSNGALSHDTITLSNFDGKNIQITGEHSSSFSSVITNGVVKIETSVAEFPKDLTYIVLELEAASAKAILLIDVSSSDPPEIDDVSFDRNLYNGKFHNGVLSHDTITLSNFDGKNIQITGEHSSSFSSEITNGVVKIVTTVAEFPKDVTFIVLELQAASANAILFIDVSSSEPPETGDVSFDQNLYNGKFQNGVLSHDTITLSGFDGKNIQITGEHSSSFSSEITNGVVKIKTSVAEFPKDLTYIVLKLQADSANAILFIDVSSSKPPEIDDVSFDRILYNGKFSNGALSHDTITLSNFDGKNIQITGEHSSSFSSVITNGVVKIETSVAEFPKDLTYIVLELEAASAKAILLIDVSSSDPPEIDDVSFDRNLYNGKFHNGVLSHDTITLSNFDGKNIQITGEHSSSFSSEITNGVVKIVTTVAEFPKDVTFIVLELQAASANAILFIDVSSSEPPETGDISFDQNLYNGKFQNGVLSHDTITLSGFDGKNIQITGEHSSSFSSEITNGVVKIKTSVAEFPKDLTYIVLELQADSANAILFIDVSSLKPPENDDVSFDRILYNGKFSNGALSHDTITLSNFDGKNIQITGEHSSSFSSVITNGVVKIETSVAEFPKDLTYIVLELEAASAKAILLIDVSSSDPPEIDDVSFDRNLYNGKFHNGVLSHDTITLSNFDGKNIQITGEHSSSFSSEITNGVVKIVTTVAEFPKDVTFIVLELQAASANAILFIDVSSSEPPETGDVSFDQNLYNGKFQNGVLSHDTITLSGFDGKNIQITGEHSSSFSSEITNGVVKIKTSVAEFPKDLTYIVLKLQADSANAILFIDVSSSKPPEIDDVSFDRILYNGKFSNGALSHDTITLSNFDGKNIQITGEHSSSFSSVITNGVVKIETSVAEFPKDLTYIVLELEAASAKAILLIDVSSSDPPEIDDVSFDRNLYNGKFHNGVLSHDTITLSNFDGKNIQITGEHSSSFSSEITNGVVKIVTTVAEFPKDVTFIVLELQAASANAILFIDVSSSEPPETGDVSFDQNLYNGKFQNGVLSHDTITLSGFDGKNIQITGEHSSSFSSEITNGVVKIKTSVAEFPKDLTYIVLKLQADSANAILFIDVSSSKPPEIDDVSFDRILYNGKFSNGALSHDTITLSNFDGKNIQITGEHSSSFSSVITNGVVKIETSVAEFPKDLTYIVLELEAASAKAILLIAVSSSENPDLPTVSFKSESYLLWADVQQTGVVGTVEATADNGEDIVYSLSVINEHIQSRININSNGEILLTAAFDKGVYTFNAVATSVKSQVQAIAPVLLRVDTLPECNNEPGLSPLIVLERLEEEPHRNLVVLNKNEHKGCQYTLSNVFPKDQSWLYVDNDGLHAKAIDREDGSIAFMTLSQIQVELTLDCDSDEVPAFSKRSLGTEDKSDLYSYDDGLNKWVLTDTILFNARRSFVNLIVKDINDNSPIFLGKGNEPIYVGYPVSELEGTVLPRALTELKATDADIGENAAIIYWSGEDNLAVSPNTGLVHVRNNAELENDSRLRIYAIDQNGRGRNGTIDIVVKLLDKNQIVVLTVRDAFLEDEVDVLNELSAAVGYEIKALKAVVIPNNNEELSRRKRDVASNSRASLQLYVYGLLESEPVDINQLTRDINNISIATVNIARIVRLEDHLAIRPARGLLASTISLAILLFIVIVAIAVRLFLKRKKSNNYEQFSNRNSSESQVSSENLPKIEVVPKPRPDIGEIKRTERRLQEMLDMPIENAFVLQESNEVKPPVKPPVKTPVIPPVKPPVKPRVKPLDDAIVNISPPDTQIPVVIQSVNKLKDKNDDSDDNDEFGETKKPRKSVVTFNENVEKIIHIEDVPDDEKSENNLETYKF